ncbi:hypothetical protein DRO97_06440 [Archaeoglobales archaeon]|nr:MAG: hypothetical protein DRO97_06440 [Archaeoglobales archaeon]
MVQNDCSGTDPLDLIIKKTENRRVMVKYDSSYPTLVLLYYHLLPVFKTKRISIICFSDTVCRRIKEAYESFSTKYPEITEIMDKAKFVKIGTKKCSPIGKNKCKEGGELLFLPWGDTSEIILQLENFVKDLGADDVLFIYGSYVIPTFYGTSSLRHMLTFFESIPYDVTLISFCPSQILNESTYKIVERFYDIVLAIKKGEEFYFDDETYFIEVEESIILDVKPCYGKYKIGVDGRLEKV